MKNVFKILSLASVLLFFGACDSKESGTEDSLRLSTERIAVSDGYGSQTITVSAGMEWTAMSSSTWCSVEPAKGGAGNSTVTVSFEKNTSSHQRSAILTFLSGMSKGTLEVVQAGAAAGGDDDDDPSSDTHEDAKANRWVYSELCDWYLYNTELKGAAPSDYNKDCEEFLSDMLMGLKTNTLDGGTDYYGSKYIYSYIERYSSSTRAYDFDPIYGFDFQFDYADYYDPTSMDLLAKVLYVLPGSPAEKAGLRRGDEIVKVNGTKITLYNYEDIMYDYMLYPTAGASVSMVLSGGRTVSMTPAAIPSTPIVCHKTLDRGGKKVGYLMFSAFETGYASDGSSYEYEDGLEEIFSGFRSQGVSEMVLDLRYNGGGYLSTAQVLASLMIPAGKLGSVMASLMYNDDIMKSHTADELGSPIRFRSSLASKTIGLDKIYVLATDMSASASEEVINALRGVDVEVVHIGTTTEGKNVGMDYFGQTFGAYYYEMWPVTFISANAKGFYQYENGFTPQYEYDEWNDDVWYDLGDEREALLSIALDLIDGKTPSKQASLTRASGRRLSGVGKHARVPGLRNNMK